MQPTSVIPASRVTPPVAHGCPRSRLHDDLAAVRDSGLAIVAAPTGSGKTTLLAGWAAGFDGSVAWYRADPADLERHDLASCVDAALARAAVEVAQTDEVDVDAVMTAVERHGRSVLLVIDDAHLLGADGTTDLQRIVVTAPPNLQLLVGSRTLPRINLTRTALGGLPVMISGEDLRYRSWEVEALFGHYGEPLAPDDAVELTRRTDGWAAALTLFHLATTGRQPEARHLAVRMLTDRPRFAADYLTAEILTGLTEPDRTFLRRTSVFDVLTAQRCDRLLGTTDSQLRLERVESAQALTFSDDGGLTFRCHEVLRRHLHEELYVELGEEAALAWHAAAADVLEPDGLPVEVLRARCRAADWTGVRNVMSAHGPQLAETPAEEWVDLLPPALRREDPWVALARARSLLRDGRLAAAEQAALDARAHSDQPPAQALFDDLARTARAWLRGPQHPAAATPTWVDVVRCATERAPGELGAAVHRLGAHGELAGGLVHAISGDMRAAGPMLHRAGAAGGDLCLATVARMTLAAFQALTQPQSPDVQRVLEETCADAERLGLHWLVRVGRGVVLAAEGTAESTALAHELADRSTLRGDLWTATVTHAALALRSLRAGAPDLAVLDTLIGEFRTLHAGALEAWARVARALALAAGDEPEAEQEARAAESFARAAGVPAAQSLAYTALAMASPHERAEFEELARTTAHTVGLTTLPWDWLQRSPVQGPAAATLRIDCFRTFRIRVGGVELAVDGVRPRARSLLRLLCMHAGRSVHRQRITGALWPEMTDDAAMRNLQVAVSSVRKLLLDIGAPMRIGREGDAYRLVTETPTAYDIAEFDAALAAAAAARARGEPTAAADALSRALNRYAGDLLAEEGSAEWVAETRDHYRTQASDAAGALAELRLQLGDADLAAVAARQGVHIDRWHDGCWRALVHAHLDRGDRAAGHRAETRYRDMLAELELTD